MLTIHFVDEKHLLLTYNSRRLLRRLPECLPEDQDRSIDALLLELPSGKVVGRTEWRAHDRGQYLWSLGHGRFMLRTRNTLTTFAPMANLASGHPFEERPLVLSKQPIEAVLLSPAADFLVLETKAKDAENTISLTASAAENAPDPVEVNFFRVSMPDSPGDVVMLRPAGQISAAGPGRLPADSRGFIAILDQGQQHWAFDFRLYTGKVKELSPFDSTCRPTPILVSRSEFIAFGCHQGHTPQVIGGFNMRGEEMWEQTFYESYLSPNFTFAPEGGRFAMSRLISRTSYDVADIASAPDTVGPQSVTVYQTDSGKQILHIDCSPIERAGQNFALSSDGMNLAVIRNETLEVYNLPPLTTEEQKAVQLAQASVPEENDGAVQFGSAAGATTIAGNEQGTATTTAPAIPTTTGEAESSPKSPVISQNPDTGAIANPMPSGAKPVPEVSSSEAADHIDSLDDQQEGRRKPPTLYTLPGERGAAEPDNTQTQPQ